MGRGPGFAARDDKIQTKSSAGGVSFVTTMKNALLRFLRLSRPMLVLACIISWASWHAQPAGSADSGPKSPGEIPSRMERAVPGRVSVCSSDAAGALAQREYRRKELTRPQASF